MAFSFSLTQWSNSPHVDISLHIDTLFWFWAIQSLLFLFNAACLAEKQQLSVTGEGYSINRSSALNIRYLRFYCHIKFYFKIRWKSRHYTNTMITWPLPKRGSLPCHQYLWCSCSRTLHIWNNPVELSVKYQMIYRTWKRWIK